MKVSVIQMNMRSLESKANFDRAEALVRRAVGENGPDVVVLPETWNTGFMPAGDLAAASDEDAKAVRARFSPLARELNVNIVAGSVSNRRGGKIYNTACVFDRAGACIAEYDKTHPFTPMGEHKVYTPGDHLVTFTLDSVRCGLLICYEVRFPELWRTLALRGAQVMFLPAQWTARANTTGRRSPPPARSKTSSLSSRATPAASATARCTAAFRASSTRWARS